MITEIVKGADDEIEFKGFKGRYFYRLIYMVLGLTTLSFLFYGLGFSSFLFFLFMAGLGAFGFYYIRREMHKNKKYGHIHETHNPPKAVIQNKRFFKMIKR